MDALGHLRGILIGLALWSTSIHTPYAFGSPTVDFSGKITLQGGKLTAQSVRSSLRQVMEEVSRLNGTEVRWMDPDVREQEVSVEFTNLPIPEAVRQILRGQDFMLQHTSSGKGMQLTQIWITSRREGGGQPVLNRQLAPQVQPTPTVEEQAEDVEQPLNALIQTAMSDADLASRLSAIESLEPYVQEDARVRETLSELAHYDSNPQVRDVASAALAGTE